ncbi:MAG: SRPBCC domain-containing protein [Actinomycetota bacterium]
MTDDSTIVRYRRQIDAPAEVVFGLLSTAAGMTEWLAVDAEIDLRVGGQIRWTHANGARVAGRILAVEPPTRLVFTYGWIGSEDVAPGRTEVAIELLAEPGGARTELTLVHRELPTDRRDDHRAGWVHFLGELASVSGRLAGDQRASDEAGRSAT